MPGIWFGAPFDLCGYHQMPRHAAPTINRQSPLLGSAWSRSLLPQLSACAASQPLAWQSGHLGAASERRELGLEKSQGSSGAEMEQTQRRGGKEAGGRKQQRRGEQRREA